jgi:hypothetical protein
MTNDDYFILLTAIDKMAYSLQCPIADIITALHEKNLITLDLASKIQASMME